MVGTGNSEEVVWVAWQDNGNQYRKQWWRRRSKFLLVEDWMGYLLVDLIIRGMKFLDDFAVEPQIKNISDEAPWWGYSTNPYTSH